MKHTQLKDALRNIRRQFLLFLSIAAITMMGTAAYLSIHFSILAMAKNGSESYTGLKFRDFEVVSTKMLSSADLEAIRGVEGVAVAEPVWQTGGKVSDGAESEEVTIVSITEETNLLMVQEGRLPEGPAECAVEERLMNQFGWKMGDIINIQGTDGETPAYLAGNSLRITCIANHPDHTNLAAPDALYIMVPRRPLI